MPDHFDTNAAADLATASGLEAKNEAARRTMVTATDYWRNLERNAGDTACDWSARLNRGLHITPYEFEIESKEYAEVALLHELPARSCPSLYLIDIPTARVEVAKAAFDAIKAEKQKRGATPKIVDRTRRGACIYVGKCSGRGQSVRARLKQHLAWDMEASSGTTALRLSGWLPDECWPVRIRVAMLGPRHPDSDIPKHLVHFLEDILWDSMQPLFGRQGGN